MVKSIIASIRRKDTRLALAQLLSRLVHGDEGRETRRDGPARQAPQDAFRDALGHYLTAIGALHQGAAVLKMWHQANPPSRPDSKRRPDRVEAIESLAEDMFVGALEACEATVLDESTRAEFGNPPSPELAAWFFEEAQNALMRAHDGTEAVLSALTHTWLPEAPSGVREMARLKVCLANLNGDVFALGASRDSGGS